MARLHYCENGNTVTDQVLLFKKIGRNEDFIFIKNYYDDFKDWWYPKAKEYMDRETFDAEWNIKLCKAINSFRIEKADSIAKVKGYTRIGAFNGWFYTILHNWCLNIKSSAFRVKRRPPVQCPICGRWIPRLDEDHLRHFKTVSDLPKAFQWKRNIYELNTTPRLFVTMWGNYTEKKLFDINKGKRSDYVNQKRRVSWLFFQEDGTRGVMCPFTKQIKPFIDNDYLRTLDKKYNRYAEPISWVDFQERHPMVLIQAEIYSIDMSDDDDKVFLRNSISRDDSYCEIDHNNLDTVQKLRFENVFNVIESSVEEEGDRTILKLIAIGYSMADIAEVTGLAKREVKKKVRTIRDTCGKEMAGQLAAE